MSIYEAKMDYIYNIMKRFLSLIIMITYMASAIGLTFSFHYCGGHYKGFYLTADTEKDCCGKNEHKTRCCHDKVVKAKFKEDHSYSVKTILSKVLFADAIVFKSPVFSVQPFPQLRESFVSNDASPPRSRGVPIYLLNRVFRI